jgi:glycosyltransferase involved in cell wall biosynthesis
MKISIVTVCYNSEETIRDTIKSVLEQTYQNIEYVIVDGGSTDNTLSIIDEYKQRIAVFKSEPDDGIYDAMNKGVRLSSGDYVGILNSDDLFYDINVVSNMVDVINQNNMDCDGVYGDLVFVDRKNTNDIKRSYLSDNFKVWMLRFGLIFPHPTFYVKRSAFEKFGYYKLDYRVAADFELMVRFIGAEVKLIRNPRKMVKMRLGGISTTGFWWRIHQNMEIVRACRENGIYTNIIFVLCKIPYKLLGFIRR